MMSLFEFFRWSVVGAVGLALPLFFGACEPAPQPAATQAFAVRFPVKLGGKTVRVQVALTSLETSAGLMGRRSLEADEGMLFVFANTQQREFWMREVPINLSLGYFTADGRLDEIKVLIAENPETVPSRSTEIKFVLEMREGWFEANGVSAGASLDTAAVREAVRARGFKVRQFFDGTD
jgi:uncharacterized membrane protein (UPF0127 family)